MSSDASSSRLPAWQMPPYSAELAAPARRPIDYVAMRVTGLLLSVLVLGHFAVTHFVTDVARDDSAFVTRRLSAAVWIAWDTAMLAAALVHGALGVRIALADYSGSARTQRRLEKAVLALAFALFVLGTIAIARSAHA
jgi:succinate dehydrogenase hydrophobic anchor subunit